MSLLNELIRELKLNPHLDGAWISADRTFKITLFPQIMEFRGCYTGIHKYNTPTFQKILRSLNDRNCIVSHLTCNEGILELLVEREEEQIFFIIAGEMEESYKVDTRIAGIKQQIQDWMEVLFVWS